jgi:hypothetical protein
VLKNYLEIVQQEGHCSKAKAVLDKIKKGNSSKGNESSEMQITL